MTDKIQGFDEWFEKTFSGIWIRKAPKLIARLAWNAGVTNAVLMDEDCAKIKDIKKLIEKDGEDDGKV